MSDPPPREGARWGEDPRLPDPSPPPRSQYDTLCAEYGEANVQKAMSHVERVFIEYPHLALRSVPKIEMAGLFLRSAAINMRIALDDGRSHTMPATLDKLGEGFGSFASSSNMQPSIMSPELYITISYGDEHNGNAARQEAARVADAEREAREKKERIQGSVILGATVIGFFFGASAGIWWGAFVAVVTFFVVGGIVANL